MKAKTTEEVWLEGVGGELWVSLDELRKAVDYILIVFQDTPMTDSERRFLNGIIHSQFDKFFSSPSFTSKEEMKEGRAKDLNKAAKGLNKADCEQTVQNKSDKGSTIPHKDASLALPYYCEFCNQGFEKQEGVCCCGGTIKKKRKAK
jgi:hypothetical protein